jgi:hypothetical protein
MSKLPDYISLQDRQVVKVPGPDGTRSTYQFDLQTRSFHRTDCGHSLTCKHGPSHIAEDKIPNATCDSPGLMSEDDKCKLDAFTGTRIGILGFMGAGSPDSGGFLEGDIILAAGSDFISLERIGNIVRFNVEMPVPLNCGCEGTSELYLVQDITDVDKLRPSNCAGRIPGLNVYNEFSAFITPQTSITTQSDANVIFEQKDKYPSLIFKRHTTSNLAEFHLTLQRTSNTDPTTNVGWHFTPGIQPTAVATNVFVMGRDDLGNLIKFEFEATKDPDLLGSILYKGNSLTKKMAVVVGYTDTVPTDNRYILREWDVVNSRVKGDRFTARNVWNVENPENPASGPNPSRLILDSTKNLLKIGSLVDIWSFKVGSSSSGNIYRYFFSKEPALDPNDLWSEPDYVSFGDVLIKRNESTSLTGSIPPSMMNNDIRNFESGNWGLTGYDDPLMFEVGDSTDLTGGVYDVNIDSRARVDITIPGMIIDDPTNETPIRPVFLWNRSNHRDFYAAFRIGRPESSAFTPLDIIFRSPIDNHDNKYLFVTNVDDVDNVKYVHTNGLNFSEIPPSGTIRNLTPGSRRNEIFEYTRKMMVMPGSSTDGFMSPGVVLVGFEGDENEFMANPGDVFEILHNDYDSNIIRLDWEVEPDSNIQRLQFKVGRLDTSRSYENDIQSEIDDFVRGIEPGFYASSVYSQAGFWSGIGSKPMTSIPEFAIYDGGFISSGTVEEGWNMLEVMVRDGQLWIWWNKLLIPPNIAQNTALPNPIVDGMPFYPVKPGIGKVGLRMFPGTKLRSFQLRSKVRLFNEFSNGNIRIT